MRWSANNLLFGGMAAVALTVIIVLVAGEDKLKELIPSPEPPIVEIEEPGEEPKVSDIRQFKSKEEFETYFKAGRDQINALGGGGFGGPVEMFATREGVIMAPGMEKATGVPSGAPERFSGTNVQVAGVDEPDILKTDGQRIYFSSEIFGMEPMPLFEEFGRAEFYPRPTGETKVIKAFPPSELSMEGKIEMAGELLLEEKNLIISNQRRFIGYDISNPKNPQKEWNFDLENNSSLVDARLYQGKVYVALKTFTDSCPIRPFSFGDGAVEIPCLEIYHPVEQVPVDSVFTALVLNPENGKVEKEISFTGSSGSTIFYMSEEAIYLTYDLGRDIFGFYAGFANEEAKDIFPSDFREKLGKLADYELSQSARLAELQSMLNGLYLSMDADEQLRFQNEIANRLAAYFKKEKRGLEKTSIVKIGLRDFKVSALGEIPGQPLNQFSLDEYEGYLRVATTVGESGFWSLGVLGFVTGGREESANDIYVLDENLKTVGSVLDLGLTERIYSARFVGERGYLVTFRQIDPFYVLDLANPQKPRMAGELKIPGFSSYLHPIDESRVLGIGQENSQVKISLFDVSSASSPKEKDKYLLNEYWSEVLSNYHAFLLDSKHKIFFLPGGQGGYIFSYKNDELSLEKAVSEASVRRALYLDDYLYLVGDAGIIVLNENNWEKIKELKDFSAL